MDNFIEKLAFKLAKYSADSIVLDRYQREAYDFEVEKYFEKNKERFLRMASEIIDLVDGATFEYPEDY